MSRIWIGVALLLAGVAAAPPPAGAVDLVIRNGRVLDGLGNPPVDADVVVDDGRIRFVGDSGRSVRADREIDAAGRIVAPGFIDLHGHGDPLTTPAFEDLLAMGVTTITLGQDGSSPVVDDLGAWLDDVGARGIGVNLAMLVGHGTLREQAGIGTRPDPDIAGIEALRSRLDAALDHAFGLSLGLERPPGRDAGELELRAMARIAGARDRVVMGRPRSLRDAELERSLDELVRLGSHARMHVACLESVGGAGPLRAEEVLFRLDLARRQGVRITADVYPSAASGGTIGAADANAGNAVPDQALQDRLLVDPFVAVASDCSPTGAHPQGYGAHARFVAEQVRVRGLLGLPEAVRKMTSLPAAIVGIAERGRIEPGFAADLVIFDPARVRAPAAGTGPRHFAEGFDVVIVNGRIARAAGALDPGRHGAILRPPPVVSTIRP